MHRLEAASKAILDFVHERTMRPCDPAEIELLAKLRVLTHEIAIINFHFARYDAGIREPNPAIEERIAKLRKIGVKP